MRISLGKIFLRVGRQSLPILTMVTLGSLTDSKSSCANKKMSDYQSSSERLAHQDRMVDLYIDELLKNPELNIREIPDAIEKHLYKFTIKLTLNAIFSSVCQLDGIEILGHHISLDYLPVDIKVLPRPLRPLDRKPLHSFVTKLLEEKMVNIGWISDSIEHKLYFNCVILIFTVLQSFMGTTKIDILGHSITLDMSPFEIDYQAVAKHTIARRHSVSETIIDTLVDDLLASDMNSGYIPDVIERGLYKTLYALILSLLDELFAHMKINFIGDQILFQLKAGSLDPHSRFYLLDNLSNAEENELLTSSLPAATPLQLHEQYRLLLLEERRCKKILENIQMKKESFHLLLPETEAAVGLEEVFPATPTGFSLFVATVGFLLYCTGQSRAN